MPSAPSSSAQRPPYAWRLHLGSRLERWLARPPDTARPIVLDARRIYILPSGGGLLFALALLVMLLGAINYDLGLGHALVFLLAALGLVGMVHTWRNLLRLRLTPGRPEPVFAGETARFPCLIENSDRTPRRALEFSVAGQVPNISLDVDARASLRALIPCPACLPPGRILLQSLLILARSLTRAPPCTEWVPFTAPGGGICRTAIRVVACALRIPSAQSARIRNIRSSTRSEGMSVWRTRRLSIPQQ